VRLFLRPKIPRREALQDRAATSADRWVPLPQFAGVLQAAVDDLAQKALATLIMRNPQARARSARVRSYVCEHVCFVRKRHRPCVCVQLRLSIADRAFLNKFGASPSARGTLTPPAAFSSDPTLPRFFEGAMQARLAHRDDSCNQPVPTREQI
jgi:hypothetical protein